MDCVGVCGSVASVGVTLTIIEETGPFHIECISNALEKISQIGELIYCKRHAFISMKEKIMY